ncbi:serine/threonine-protein kinase [Evansella vedderi]|uniref:Serine/threonine-protein kinase n=1 Tax=Evansella vedderi TaxID=38282 RepID=A0ABT9ZZU3_9BACI|nr:PASTA domain-containing protein [Evansella vedderi]MDQ0255968.1 serine/threonine-protein kinase [Evansella vedderi]
MSDFLSNFNKDKYNQFMNEREKEKTSNNDKNKSERQEEELEIAGESETDQTSVKEQIFEGSTNSSKANVAAKSIVNRHMESVEEMEIDPEYKKKRRRTIIYLITGGVLALFLLFLLYYQAVHVIMEDFVGQPISDARAWANENGLEVELLHETSMEYDVNQIISQSTLEGTRVRKGETITLIGSTGPDLDERIVLPNFEEMSLYEVETWIASEKAENIQIITEYSDEVEEGNFIRLAIRDSNVNEEEYRRRDRAIVYYSRGKETFERNITVPDFVGKPRHEVEQWAENNEIEMTYTEKDSNNVEAGMIISQSIRDEKLAKRDKMEVVVSLGKAIIVPDFSELTMEEAMNYTGLNVMMQQRFHGNVPYGGLISQSIKAGTKLIEGDNMDIKVVYSEGQPFLRDYRGLLEGELPRLFYEDYRSKGANVHYKVKYVEAPEVKGTVVSMSNFNEFVPMDYQVEIRVSNNKKGNSSPWEDGGAHEPLPMEEELENK